MDRKKLIYIGSILILTVIVSITYFSYAFFTNKQEFHGKLNIVAGTLDYRISSNDLTNNSITLGGNETKEIEISIKSLNDIESKYELYYETNNNDIEIGYSSSSEDNPKGTINSKETKKVTVIIKNKSTSSAKIIFGVQGGFTNKNLALLQGKSLEEITGSCQYQSGQVFTFDYTGSEQEFEVPCDGNYKIELWGAQGGGNLNNYGGYTEGNIVLSSDMKLYLYVGNQPARNTENAFNGGGLAQNTWYPTDDGGGATDIRYFGNTTPTASNLNWDSSIGLNSRIMVASAGGGVVAGATHKTGDGYAGGLTGYSGTNKNVNIMPSGGTQISGGVKAADGYPGFDGTFGKGGNGEGYNSDRYGGGGGGGGYYGGGGGGNGNSVSSGAGGSSFISGHTGCVAIAEGSATEPRTVRKSGCTTGTTDNECSKHYSGLVFTNTKMIDGAGYSWTNVKGSLEQMPNPSGGYYASGTGHTGNGYARITYLGD